MRSKVETTNRLASLNKFLCKLQDKVLETTKKSKHQVGAILLQEALLEGYTAGLRWILGEEGDNDFVDIAEMKMKLGEAFSKWPDAPPPKEMYD